MADSDESEIDDDEFMKIFEDSDDENEFEGFGPDYEILREIDLQQSLKDRNVQEDDEFGWLRDDSPPLCAPFTATPGLNMQLPEDPKPIFFFNLLFKDDMWSLIKTQTNLYAQKRIENGELKDTSRLQKWRPVIVDEMKVFLSLVIVMGLTHKGDVDAYWATDEVIATPFFNKMMAKDRFYAILSNLHLVDNDHAPEDDRLNKVRPFVTMRRETFDIYTPEEHLSFDEGTCPFKGRVKFKVYNPMKPNKFGIKLYQVCEAKSALIFTTQILCEVVLFIVMLLTLIQNAHTQQSLFLAYCHFVDF